MALIAIKSRRSLTQLAYPDLEAYWWDLIGLLQKQWTDCGGMLPPLYQSAWERVRDEFAARGVQLTLF